MPIAAVVGKAEIMDAPIPGSLGGTYGGNPVACRVALAVLDMFERDDLVARARTIGDVISGRFAQMHEQYDSIGEVRGLGAMVAMELVRDRTTKELAKEETTEVLHRCHQAGLVIIKAGLYDNVVRVLVPLVVTDEQLQVGLDILEEALASVEQERASR